MTEVVVSSTRADGAYAWRVRDPYTGATADDLDDRSEVADLLRDWFEDDLNTRFKDTGVTFGALIDQWETGDDTVAAALGFETERYFVPDVQVSSRRIEVGEGCDWEDCPEPAPTSWDRWSPWKVRDDVHVPTIPEITDRFRRLDDSPEAVAHGVPLGFDPFYAARLYLTFLGREYERHGAHITDDGCLAVNTRADRRILTGLSDLDSRTWKSSHQRFMAQASWENRYETAITEFAYDRSSKQWSTTDTERTWSVGNTRDQKGTFDAILSVMHRRRIDGWTTSRDEQGNAYFLCRCALVNRPLSAQQVRERMETTAAVQELDSAHAADPSDPLAMSLGSAGEGGFHL